MALFRRDNSSIYHVEFEFQGRRVRQSTGTENRTLATAFERKLRGELYDEVVLGKIIIPQMTIREAVDRYITTHLKLKKRLPRTAINDVYLLDGLIELLGGDDIQISTLTTEVIGTWRDNVLIIGREPATANRYLANLKAILRRAHSKWKLLREVPVIELFPLSNKRTRWLTLIEEALLLQACESQPHLWNLVVFLLDTGARLSEATHLEWHNVHLNGDDGFVTFVGTKGGKFRSVPICHRLNALLIKLKAMCPETETRVFLRYLPGCEWRGTKATAKPYQYIYGAWKVYVPQTASLIL